MANNESEFPTHCYMWKVGTNEYYAMPNAPDITTREFKANPIEYKKYLPVYEDKIMTSPNEIRLISLMEGLIARGHSFKQKKGGWICQDKNKTVIAGAHTLYGVLTSIYFTPPAPMRVSTHD